MSETGTKAVTQAQIKKVLIANRGEIACRVIHTCRRLGLATVAVYSDADRQARHVRLADEAIHVGAAAPAESYLRQDRIIQAAQDTGAQAIHPGYGFLSENTEFARKAQEAGIIFIGPSAQTIERMGSKAEAKITMRAAEVPCVPGYDGADQSEASLKQAAQEVGFPLLIKASAGGGGKGMRVVHKAEEFDAALAAARREAANAFGDDHVILERFLVKPQHVEFQIFGDHHGNVVHLFERDCSSQRRYQKVIEESPSPVINDSMRDAMGAAAVAAAKAVDYVGAGTVEFIVQGEEFFFMEMNTRLQVEHPVTEMITGLDLVEWQLRVASGEPLPLQQDQIQRHGHAMEVRLYAEDAASGFLPSTGKLERLQLPRGLEQTRVDSGVDEGDEVTVHYDPMIAKIICWDKNRASASARMAQALAQSFVVGPKTNLDFLSSLLQLPLFQAGKIDTTHIDHHLEEILATDESAQQHARVLACAARLAFEQNQVSKDPWSSRSGWSNGGMLARSWRLDDGQQTHDFHITQSRETHFNQTNWTLQSGEQTYRLSLPRLNDTSLSVIINDHAYSAIIHHHRDHMSLIDAGREWRFRWRTTHEAAAGQGQHGGSLVAPMPGKIIAVNVNEGDAVNADEALVVMEAMKMEITLRAPAAGTVASIRHAVGDQVEADTLLIELDETEDS